MVKRSIPPESFSASIAMFYKAVIISDILRLFYTKKRSGNPLNPGDYMFIEKRYEDGMRPRRGRTFHGIA